MFRGLFWLVLVLRCTCTSAADVLVVYDDPLIRSTHSKYLDELQSQGHTVTIKSVTDSSIKLKDWDDWKYEKLVIFAPSATGGRSVPVYSGTSDVMGHQLC